MSPAETGVGVDDETGEADVRRIVAAHDCDTPINPMRVEGQIEGGFSMGIGFALQEEMLFDNAGRQINPHLAYYIMPIGLDMPEIEVNIVASYDPTGPFGAKGVGEPTADRCRDSQRDPRRRRRAHRFAAGNGGEGSRRHQGQTAGAPEVRSGAVKRDCGAAPWAFTEAGRPIYTRPDAMNSGAACKSARRDGFF